jgi:hypothetical protein
VGAEDIAIVPWLNPIAYGNAFALSLQGEAIAFLAIGLEWAIVEANGGSASVGFWRDFCWTNECLGEQIKLNLNRLTILLVLSAHLTILWTELRPYHAIRTHRVVGGVRFNQSGVKRQHGNKAFEEMLIERKSFVACD